MRLNICMPHWAVPYVLLLGVALPGSSASFSVNSTEDGADSNPGNGVCATVSGVCTLRAAIQEANATAGLDTITFSILSGVQTISPASALPVITNPTILDGTTQPGYVGAPIIELSGAEAGGNVDGLRITAGNSTVRALVINRFRGNGVVLSQAGGNVLEGSYIGIDLTGSLAMGNGDSGVDISGSPNNRIGGTTAAARNVISANQGNGLGGVFISGSTASGNVVQGNFIGTDATGTFALGNTGRGVAIKSAPNNLIGGTVQGARNIISGNRASGIRIFGDAPGNVVQGNYVGTDVTGTAFVGNSRGIQTRSTNTLIGGTTPEAANLVAGNSIDGVIFFEQATNNVAQGNIVRRNGGSGVLVTGGSGNAILNNRIFSNGRLGIELTPYGVTANDPGDSDTGPNNLQNFPVLNSATSSSGTTTVMGTLNSAAGTSFTLEFFANAACDPSGNGEGQRPLGQTVAATDASGNVSFVAKFSVQVPAGQFVTATATDPGGNTSEFSNCRIVSTP